VLLAKVCGARGLSGVIAIGTLRGLLGRGCGDDDDWGVRREGFEIEGREGERFLSFERVSEGRNVNAGE